MNLGLIQSPHKSEISSNVETLLLWLGDDVSDRIVVMANER